jgi:DNA polymerase V
MIAAARRGACKIWRDGYAYTKAGIMLDDLLPEEERRRTLFEADTNKRDRLMTALDDINGRFGSWTAVTASQGFKREWKARSLMRSPAWTTDILQVPTARA